MRLLKGTFVNIGLLNKNHISCLKAKTNVQNFLKHNRELLAILPREKRFFSVEKSQIFFMYTDKQDLFEFSNLNVYMVWSHMN